MTKRAALPLTYVAAGGERQAASWPLALVRAGRGPVVISSATRNLVGTTVASITTLVDVLDQFGGTSIVLVAVLVVFDLRHDRDSLVISTASSFHWTEADDIEDIDT